MTCCKCGADKAEGKRCAACATAYRSVWVTRNKDKIAKYGHKFFKAHYVKRPRKAKRSLAEKRAAEKAYRERNKAAIAADQRVRYAVAKAGRAAYCASWKKTNKANVAAYTHARRARERAAPGAFTAEEFIRICSDQGGACFDCGIVIALTVGHLIPLSQPGTSNYPENIIGQCQRCNSKQGRNIHPSVLESAVA